MTHIKVDASGNITKQTIIKKLDIIANIILFLAIVIIWVGVLEGVGQEELNRGHFLFVVGLILLAVSAFLMSTLRKMGRTWTTQTTNNSSQQKK